MKKLQTTFLDKTSPATEENYYEMLGCVPPAAMASNGFLVGEPWDHQGEGGAARYSFYFTEAGLYYYAGLATMKDFMTWIISVDAPIPGKQYALTSGTGKPSILHGDSWEASEVQS